MITLLYAMLGAIIGSFCNVVIYRLPRMLQGQKMTLSWPASHCPQCQQPVKARYNIPVAGWLILRGRCASCHSPIALSYPLVELLVALLFAVIVWRQGVNVQSQFDLLAVSLLVPLFFIDIRTQLLPDRLTLTLTGLALIFAASGLGHIDLASSALAAVSGFGVPWLLSRVFYMLRGVEGMGMGDMKLFAGIGAWLGPLALLDIVSISSCLALLCALTILRIKPGQPFAFGPYPIVSAVGWVVCFH